MPTLYLRDVPEDLLEKLRALAAAERRSTAQEAVRLLERALAEAPGPDRRFQAVLRRLRRQHGGARRARRRPSTEDLVREDRDR